MDKAFDELNRKTVEKTIFNVWLPKGGVLTMRTRNQLVCFTLAVLTCAFGVLLSRQASAQYQAPTLKDEPMIGVELKNPKIKRFALERARLVADIAHQIGFYPIQSGDFGHATSVLFPLGRSDRAYALFRPWPDYDMRHQQKDILCCYQRTHGVAKLVYKINLLLADPKKSKRPTISPGISLSLLAYLKSRETYWPDKNNQWVPTHYDLLASVTSMEIKDLVIKREYVEYYTEVPDDGVRVSLISNDNSGDLDGLYDYSDDPNPAIRRLGPVAVARLRPYGFDFKKEYGLPPAFAELKLLGRRSVRPAQLSHQ